MKPLAFTPKFEKKLKLLALRDKKIIKKINAQLALFRKNQKHPSLRLHKLKGNLKDCWSLSVSESFRLVFIDSDKYYFFDLGEHDEVYGN